MFDPILDWTAFYIALMLTVIVILEVIQVLRSGKST